MTLKLGANFETRVTPNFGNILLVRGIHLKTVILPPSGTDAFTLTSRGPGQSEPTRRVPQSSCPASDMFPEIREAGSNDTHGDILFLPAEDTSLALKKLSPAPK